MTEKIKKFVDAYLSRKVQGVFPAFLIYRVEEDGMTYYVLERKEGDVVCLGFKFGEAKASVDVLVNAEKARGKL